MNSKIVAPINDRSSLETILEDQSDATSLVNATSTLKHRKAASSSNSSVNSSTGAVDSVKQSATSNVCVLLGEENSDEIASESVVADPTPPEQDEKGRNTGCQEFWTRRMIILVTAASALVAIVSSAIGIVVLKSDKNVNAETEDFQSTTGPSASPTLMDPIAVMNEILETVSSKTMLYEIEDSPQYKAREWMRDDELRDIVLRKGPTRVTQRYALVQFYFATGGPDWNNTFLDSKTSECEWVGVTCDPAISLSDTVFRLYLRGNNLVGSIPEELGAIETLRELDLSENYLAGSIPASLFLSWEALYWLDLSKNQLAGAVPSVLWSMRELRFLYLNENQLTGKIQRPPPTRSVQALATLENQLTDIPATSKSLQKVWIFGNKLSGTIPTWFSTLHDLEHWLAFENSFTGSIPDPLPGALKHFDLSFNRIAGTIPESLWSLVESPPLEELYLDHNQLRGPLPNANHLRRDIKKIWLNDNMLSGEIPDGFGMLWTKLIEFKIHHNQLNGSLGPVVNTSDPGELGGYCSTLWPSLTMLKADCLERFANDRPPVQCDCCTDCEA